MVFECATTTTVPAGAVGSLGGGCDHARRWQAAQWPALAAGKRPGRPEPPGALEGAQEPRPGPGSARLALALAVAPQEPWP